MLINEFRVRVDFELAMRAPVDDTLLTISIETVINQALEKWLEDRRALCSSPAVTVMRQPKELS